MSLSNTPQNGSNHIPVGKVRLRISKRLLEKMGNRNFEENPMSSEEALRLATSSQPLNDSLPSTSSQFGKVMKNIVAGGLGVIILGIGFGVYNYMAKKAKEEREMQELAKIYSQDPISPVELPDSTSVVNLEFTPLPPVAPVPEPVIEASAVEENINTNTPDPTTFIYTTKQLAQMLVDSQKPSPAPIVTKDTLQLEPKPAPQILTERQHHVLGLYLANYMKVHNLKNIDTAMDAMRKEKGISENLGKDVRDAWLVLLSAGNCDTSKFLGKRFIKGINLNEWEDVRTAATKFKQRIETIKATTGETNALDTLERQKQKQEALEHVVRMQKQGKRKKSPKQEESKPILRKSRPTAASKVSPSTNALPDFDIW